MSDPWYSSAVHGESALGLGASIAAAIRTTRVALGLTQRDLSERSGVSQPAICRIEREHLSRVPFGSVQRLLSTLGVSIEAVVHEPTIVGRRDQPDAAHARCSAFVRRRLEALGWSVAQEVEIGGDRFRGWIDNLAYHGAARILFVGEIKTETDDVGGAQRQLGWYEREAWTAARRLGWQPDRMVVALLVLATRRMDLLISRNATLLRQAFPTRARTLGRILADPATMEWRIVRGLALIDPRSRRAEWLRPSRSDGRRSLAPYADYADFMRRIEADRARRNAR